MNGCGKAGGRRRGEKREASQGVEGEEEVMVWGWSGNLKKERRVRRGEGLVGVLIWFWIKLHSPCLDLDGCQDSGLPRKQLEMDVILELGSWIKVLARGSIIYEIDAYSPILSISWVGWALDVSQTMRLETIGPHPLL